MTYTKQTCEWEYDKTSVKCAKDLTEKIYNFSMSKYGKPLCFGHQKQTDELNNLEEGYASAKDWQESTDPNWGER